MPFFSVFLNLIFSVLICHTYNIPVTSGKGSLGLEDHVSSQKKPNENDPETAGGLPSGGHVLTTNSVSEASGIKRTKRKVNEGVVGDNKVGINTTQFSTQQEQPVEYIESTGGSISLCFVPVSFNLWLFPFS